MADLDKNWKTLIKPYRIRVVSGSDEGRSASFVFEPLESGFGVTLGTALRRVSLSCLRGAAVTAVKFSNVLHAFSPLPGALEDVADVILNLKALDIALSEKEEATVVLKADKPGLVTAGMIQGDSDVRFLSPDQPICTLAEGGKLDIEIQVKSGKGYGALAQDAEPVELPLGTIAVEANFNPVRSFSFEVENARAGQFTNYDRLLIDMKTDGSISPKDAISAAACILQEQLSRFVSFSCEVDVGAVSKPADSSSDSGVNPDLLRKVEELELSLRAQNCLNKEGIARVGDLVSRTEEDLLRAPNFGSKSLSEIVDALAQMGLKLGMSLKGWPPASLSSQPPAGSVLKQSGPDISSAVGGE